MSNSRYVIATGREGRDRLRLLTRVFEKTTTRLLDDVGVGEGMVCLDVGCGGGDITTDLARRVGPAGRVVGIDLDAASLDIARGEAAGQGLGNIEYKVLDIFALQEIDRFDFIYARFLLSHLPDPSTALGLMFRALSPGGIVVVEDIDFSGNFCSPECPAFQEYNRLYSKVVRSKGSDPDIGPRLPSLLREAGLSEIGMNVVQPAGTSGEVKLISPITMEKIGEAVIAGGLASAAEVGRIVEELYAEARDERTVMSTPRIVQVWGTKAR